MFIDTASLRMGAGYSESAGALARRGADQFSSAPLPAGIFGDFAEAEQFHQALSHAQTNHSENMRGHHSALSKLADNATTAARVFTEEDEQSAAALEAARRGVVI
jgi:hypothetical protein